MLLIRRYFTGLSLLVVFYQGREAESQTTGKGTGKFNKHYEQKFSTRLRYCISQVLCTGVLIFQMLLFNSLTGGVGKIISVSCADL